MKRINSYYFLWVFILLSGCIKPFDPEIEDGDTSNFVVQGIVSTGGGWQEITVSRTSPVNDPAFRPISDCVVEITDDLGQSYILEERNAGVYSIWMNQGDLVPGRAYKVSVITPDGSSLESAFDKIPTGPEVNDVYFEIEDLPTNDPDAFIHGIQFYTNLIANENDSRYYRWKLTETWEYHSQYPKKIYFDGSIHELSPPDWSQSVCYITLPVDQIFTLSTANLGENTFDGFPLHFVDNATSRLSILYSLFIEQIALSEAAYNYWEDLRLNSSQDGGLYNTQPIAIKGNMINLTNPEKEVLGFFQASAVFTKRIFIETDPAFEMDFDNGCTPTELGMGSFDNISVSQYPAYLLLGANDWLLMNNACVDCTELGGTTDKPNYWPL